jgi:hypothetical protein
MDSKFYNRNYTKNYILLKLEGAKNLCIKITPSDNMYFNAAANNSPIGSVEGFKGKELVIAKDEDFNQEKPINIFSPAYIETLDLSAHAEHIF